MPGPGLSLGSRAASTAMGSLFCDAISSRPSSSCAVCFAFKASRSLRSDSSRASRSRFFLDRVPLLDGAPDIRRFEVEWLQDR